MARQKRAIRFFTSQYVERETELSGVYLRVLVQRGVIDPEKDSSGRNLYTEKDIQKIKDYRKEGWHSHLSSV